MMNNKNSSGARQGALRSAALSLLGDSLVARLGLQGQADSGAGAGSILSGFGTRSAGAGSGVDYVDLFDRDARALARNPSLFSEWSSEMRANFDRAVERGDMDAADEIGRFYRLMWNRVQSYRQGRQPGILSPDDRSFLVRFTDRYVASGGLIPPKPNPDSGRILGLSERDLDAILPILLLMVLQNR